MAGDTIAGRYRLLQELGQGAMSSVWLAEDTELERRVAVKALGPAADRARFDREARAAAALSHPHICQLYDYGEHGGRPFMVLEYLGGGTLEDRLRRRSPLPDAETQRIARELASALTHAHVRGLVHRDLKPSNVLFDNEGRAKIADFGIARMGDGGTLTEAGTVLGTAAYLSPEQAAGEPATAASDVYSFGVILFRMLTGRLPFESQSAMELVRMHRDDSPPTVEQFRPDAPVRLAAVASAALAKDAAARPRDGTALLAELGAPAETATMLLAPPDQTAATQVVPRPRAEPRRRRTAPLVAAAAAALLLAGGAVAFIATRDGGDSPRPTTTTQASVTLPTVAPGTTRPTTTAPATTAPTTTQPATTQPTTTAAPTTTHTQPTTTTAPTTTRTQPTTTAATTTAPTTTQATTTAPATTATQPTTTESIPTTTESLPTTTETLPTTTATTPTDTVTVPAPGAAG